MDNKLQIFNADVIPVYTTDTGDKVVIARELHEQLRINEKYADWFSRMGEYGFVENADYSSFSEKSEKGGRPRIDHILTLDMAKHIAMIQRTPQGMTIRQKLIELEKSSELSLPKDYPSALRALANEYEKVEKLKGENAQQKQIIAEQSPKVSYYDIILSSKNTVTISKIAKDYGKSAQWMNDFLHDHKIQYKQGNTWLLYQKYAEQGYTKSETIPYTGRYGETCSTIHTYWTQKGRLFIYVLLKQDNILPTMEINNEN